MSILKKIAEWLTPKQPPAPIATAYYLLDDGHPAAEIQTRYGTMISIYKGADQWWNMTPDLKELQERRENPDQPVQKTPCTAEEAIAAAHRVDERIKEKVYETITDHDPLGETAGYYILGQHHYGERRALDAYANYLRRGIDPPIRVKLRITWCPHPDSDKGYGMLYEPDEFTEQGDYKNMEQIRQRLAERWWRHMKDGVHRQDRYTPEEVFRLEKK